VIDLAVLDQLDGLISPVVGRALHRLAARVQVTQAIVELGSYKGKSTCYLAAGAQQGGGAHVWAVDAWDLRGNTGGRHRFADETVRDHFAAQVNRAGVAAQVTPIRAFSTVAAGLWSGLPVGLLYVDASHFYDDVIGDFVTWSRHLAPSAVVVFDDYDTPMNPGVKQAVDELVDRGALTGPVLSCPLLAVAEVRHASST
jgi:hypothetical protein